MAVSANPRLGAKANVPYILAQSGVPVCLAPNGTVATNGTIALGTALDVTYSSGIWLRLPAGAVVGGLAGMYYAVMSSTTAGQVYTNFADPATEFIPFVPPAPLVPAIGSNAAYTQVINTDVALATVRIPANSVGVLGSFTSTMIGITGGTTATKALKTNFGGQAINSRNFSAALTFWSHQTTVRARGVNNRQVSYRLGGGSYTEDSTGSQNYTTVDMSSDVLLSYTAQLIASATEYAIFSGFDILVQPS